jgi:hypothetical protein
MRPRRERPAEGDRRSVQVGQMEFRVVQAAARPVLYPPIERQRPAAASPRIEPVPSGPSSQPFGAWLLDQAKRPGMLGELAKAVRLDRQFPKSGAVDDVRRYFGTVGADGDAFEALDHAEREYDRLWR